MNRGSGRPLQRVAVLALALVLLGPAGCEKNAKLPPEPVPEVVVEKWYTAQDGQIIAAGDQVWAVSAAGLIGIAHGGTPSDPADDQYLFHNELTLGNWPADPLLAGCVDAAGLLWLATSTAVYLLDLGGTPLDATDDRLIAGGASAVAFDTNRQVLALHCSTQAAGLWIETGVGFAAVQPGDDPLDSASWTWHDYQDGGTAMAERPYAVALDAADRLWLVGFADDTYTLTAVVAGAPGDPGDDSVHPIAIDLDDPTPTALAADGSAGLWMVSGASAFHLAHGGTLDSPADDTWTALASPQGADISGVIPVAAGLGVAIANEQREFFLLDTAAPDSGSALSGFGLSDEINPLTSTQFQAGLGLWYSSALDFGVLVFEPTTLADAGWQWHRFSTTRVPANDIHGFVETDDGVFLAGSNGAVQITSGEEGLDFVDWPLESAALSEPFAFEALAAVDGGIVGGGAQLAWLGAEGWSVFDRVTKIKGVQGITVGPDSALWVTTLEETILALVGVHVYNLKGTPADGSDDAAESLENDWFGLLVGATIDAMQFFGGCQALVGNSLGLHWYDCGGTPYNGDDDTLVGDLLGDGKPVRDIEPAAGGGWWVTTIEGLLHFDDGGTAQTDDDTVVRYEQISKPSYDIAVNAEGQLFYFVDRGLVLHDPQGTPADPGDDLATVLDERTSRKATIHTDAAGGLWFSYGDGSGVYHATYKNLELQPL